MLFGLPVLVLIFMLLLMVSGAATFTVMQWVFFLGGAALVQITLNLIAMGLS